MKRVEIGWQCHVEHLIDARHAQRIAGAHLVRPAEGVISIFTVRLTADDQVIQAPLGHPFIPPSGV